MDDQEHTGLLGWLRGDQNRLRADLEELRRTVADLKVMIMAAQSDINNVHISVERVKREAGVQDGADDARIDRLEARVAELLGDRERVRTLMMGLRVAALSAAALLPFALFAREMGWL